MLLGNTLPWACVPVRISMHPVLKRILIHGALTAVMLALIGLVFVRLGDMWMAGRVDSAGTPAASTPDVDMIRIRVPLMMAFWGFVFVAVGELIRWRLFGKQPAKTTEPPPDDAEKLLNELLTQAESKMALEQETQKKETGDRSQESAGAPQVAHIQNQEPGDQQRGPESEPQRPGQPQA